LFKDSPLLITAMGIAVFHTLVGIDHYIPFVFLSKANNWKTKKTMLIVFVCGVGHVLASIALGFVGILLSTAVLKLEAIEAMRGDIATWFLIAFGLVYMLYGVRCAVKNKTHRHIGSDGHAYMHVHSSDNEEHIHDTESKKRSTNTFWGLFILLVLGPCEPLIPILMYPAFEQNTFMLVAVTVCFAFFTITTMLAATYFGLKGIKFLKTKKIERYTHLMAGFAIFSCGIAVWLLPI